MIQPLVQWFLVLQEFGALQTLLVKHNRRLKQRDSLPLNAAIGSWEIGSPPVWSRDNPEGVSGTKSPRSWRVWGGGVPSPLGSLEVVWEGAVPPSQIFFNFYLKMVSFGAFWVALYVTYLLIYWILKETVVTFRLMCERTRGCVCPSYPNNSSAAHSNSSSRTQKGVLLGPALCNECYWACSTVCIWKDNLHVEFSVFCIVYCICSYLYCIS